MSRGRGKGGKKFTAGEKKEGSTFLFLGGNPRGTLINFTYREGRGEKEGLNSLVLQERKGRSPQVGLCPGRRSFKKGKKEGENAFLITTTKEKLFSQRSQLLDYLWQREKRKGRDRDTFLSERGEKRGGVPALLLGGFA